MRTVTIAAAHECVPSLLLETPIESLQPTQIYQNTTQ